MKVLGYILVIMGVALALLLFSDTYYTWSLVGALFGMSTEKMDALMRLYSKLVLILTGMVLVVGMIALRITEKEK